MGLDISKSTGQTKRNKTLSHNVIKALRPENKQCYTNAIMGLVLLADMFKRDGIRYVEGFAVGKFPMVMSHGWLEDERGVVIEVTPSWLKDAVTYFPVFYYTMDEVAELTTTKGEVPFSDQIGMQIFQDDAVVEQFQNANRHVYGDAYDEIMAKLREYNAKNQTRTPTE